MARKSLGYSQADMARVLGVTRQSYAKVESGDKDITLSQIKIIASQLKTTPEAMVGSLEGAGFFYSDPAKEFKKYKQMIMNAMHFGADAKDQKITKTKLAKLVYLADFTWYYLKTAPMSGANYRKLPQGPVPDIYFRALDELERDGIVTREEKGKAMLYSLVEHNSVAQSELEGQEVDLIKYISTDWKGKSTQEIVDFTHEQLPWQICRDGEVIPYGLITQEEPERVYASKPVL